MGHSCAYFSTLCHVQDGNKDYYRVLLNLSKLQDLLQFTDRAQWYEAKWAAADQPEWNPSRVLRSEQVTLNQRIIVLEAEISREKVYLKNAYKHIGQQARVRVGSGLEFEVTGTWIPQISRMEWTYMIARCCFFRCV